MLYKIKHNWSKLREAWKTVRDFPDPIEMIDYELGIFSFYFEHRLADSIKDDYYIFPRLGIALNKKSQQPYSFHFNGDFLQFTFKMSFNKDWESDGYLNINNTAGMLMWDTELGDWIKIY